MDTTFLLAIVASAASSLLGLIGGFLLLWQRRSIERLTQVFVSFAAGAMLGATFFDLLPETLELSSSVHEVMVWMLGGFLLFFVLEKMLVWHHHAHSHEHHHDLQTTSRLIILGDGVHNAIDGIIIGAAFLVDPHLGLVTALAVLLHELPSELGDISVMIAAGLPRRSIIVWNVVGALVSPLATAITLVTAGAVEAMIVPLLAVASGTFLYIVSADLVPQIHREHRLSRNLIQFGSLALGLLVVVGLGSFLHE